jgi:threonyl-tRNA synthetase
MSPLLIHAGMLACEILSKTKIAIRNAEEITPVAARVGVSRVMSYPYSHLSSDLVKRQTTTTIPKDVSDVLTATRALEVRCAPFGCYKNSP